MRCQQDSESASGVLQILVAAPSSSLNYNIKMSKEILAVVRGPLTTCKISWGISENKMPTVSLCEHFIFRNERADTLFSEMPPHHFLLFPMMLILNGYPAGKVS
jgi:hypothetical protein